MNTDFDMDKLNSTMTGHHSHNVIHTVQDNSRVTGGHHAQDYFFFSTHQRILFEQWVTSSAKDIGLACLYVGLISIAYEGLKVAREIITKYQQRYTKTSKKHYSIYTGTGNNIRKKQRKEINKIDKMKSWALWFCVHFLQAQLHMIQVCMSFFLMLVAMTFNLYLCIAVVVGSGCGYFMFGWKRTSTQDVNEHCN